MDDSTLTTVSNTRCNARGYDVQAVVLPPAPSPDAVESNRVTEAATTSPRDRHPVHIKEVRR
ncbi:hypothetical protein ACFWP5_02635 [Streptomyces sp. NPDC058469]|uniref:hypothetical protein n=1 Tax=Streptomyces sp. NPDC058469 TaxID=3346514 RepID=UPI003667654D